MNRQFKSLDDLAKHMLKLAATHDVKSALLMHGIAENTKHHIQTVMGDPEKLDPNAASTMSRKGKDAPLIDTGAMQASYEAKSTVDEAGAGTPDVKALWHEYGLGRNYPARPANRIGAHEAEPENQAMIRGFGHAVLGDDAALKNAIENAKRGIA